MHMLIMTTIVSFICAGILGVLSVKTLIDLEKLDRQSKRDAATIARLKSLLRKGN